jgi:hypothetical protein
LENKLRGLLRDFEFQTMGELIGEMEGNSSSNGGLPEIPIEQIVEIADHVSVR